MKIVTAGGAPGGDYAYEKEGLAGVDAEIVETGSEADFLRHARDADAVYCRGGQMTRGMIEALQRAKVISVGSVGVDYVDVAAATERGLPVTNCPHTFIEEVADHAMMLLLAAHRRLVMQDRMVRDGRWREGRAMLYEFPRLMGQTLGFIAFGHVARLVALRAKPFGLNLLAYDPFIEELVMSSYGVESVSLNELLERSDFISMHAPATPEAQGMLREEHFRRMKPSALFINTGRGPTVDEPALIKALDENWIGGAALDVLETEPPGGNNPLLKMDKVTLTAHVASASSRFDPARRRHVGRELGLVLSGRWPMSCVNPSVLAKSDLKRWQPVSMERGPNS
jgi:D-3-phosphoglycerate dehydrogenase